MIDLLPPSLQPFALTAAEFQKISSLMHERYGIDLRRGKEGLVAARLGKKLRQGGFPNFDAYFAHVLADRTGDSLIEMVDALTTNHTSFLREIAHFDYLVHTVVPSISAGTTLKIWSAACSTGEEPYSIACALMEAMRGNPRFHILATDLSTRVLKKAREGVYPPERLQEFASWRQSFFTRTSDGNLQIKPEVGKRIDFERLNLIEPFRHTRRFHVIFCRNVMMYFDRQTQADVVRRLTLCLEPGGHLLVGHSETLTGMEHGLRYIRPATYQSACGSRLGGRL